MPSLDRILCAVDMSEASKRAFRYALALGLRTGADVRAVHVADLQGWAGTGLSRAAADDMHGLLDEAFAWWVARAIGGAVGAGTELRQGPVAPGILAAAADLMADLIVIGGRGAGGAERVVAASVVGRVLDGARCPVLVVPAGEDALVRVGSLGRIVCATDFSAASVRAARYARFFAGDPPGPLSLLTVIDPSPAAGPRGGAVRVQEAQEALVRAAADAGFAPSGLLEIRHGRAGPEVVRYARDIHAELIVLGASGAGGAGSLPPATTATRVIDEAPCPVLVVPDRDDGA